MWITKDCQIALFKVAALPERRWSIQGSNVQLIIECELTNPSVLFAIVYDLPKKLANKTFDKNTPPLLHVFGGHSKLGFHSYFEMLQHDYSLQHAQNLATVGDPAPSTKIFMPICGVAQQMRFVFTNITKKPVFRHQRDQLIHTDDTDLNESASILRSGEANDHDDDSDFGFIEIYGFSLGQILAPRSGIPMLNLSTFFQFKSTSTTRKASEASLSEEFRLSQNDYRLLMTSAECDTMCACVSIQSRYFNQAKELLTRAKRAWIQLHQGIDREVAQRGGDGDVDSNDRAFNSFIRQMRETKQSFQYNALRLEVLIAYSMNEHNDFDAQTASIVSIVNQQSNSPGTDSDLLPLQTIAKYSKILISTLLETAQDHNEFVQLASFKNIYYVLEKLGCDIKEELCSILAAIFEFESSSSKSSSDSGNVSARSGKSSARRLASKPLHIQSIMRQLMVTKHNICDAALNLISDCTFNTVAVIFEKLIVANLDRILKLEPTKLAYCLRIFELCIDRLHIAPGLTSSMLTAMTGLMYHGSTRVRNLATSIWTSFLFILPKQLLQTEVRVHQTEICAWLSHTVDTIDLNREVAFPDKSMSKKGPLQKVEVDRSQDEKVEDARNGLCDTLLLRIPLNIINKACETQMAWNEHISSDHIKGLLAIEPDALKLSETLKARIMKLLSNKDEIENYFDQFRMMLQSLDLLACAMNDYRVLDSLMTEVLSRFVDHLRTASPPLMMLRVCSEFLEYINVPSVVDGRIEDLTHDDSKFTRITLDIVRAFHQWIPHSVHDETFVLGSKLIDITALHLSHDDFACVVRSLLSKYALHSVVYAEFQNKLIAIIYRRIHDARDDDRELFQRIIEILILDAAHLSDIEAMTRHFDFAYDWLQHPGFEDLCVHDFYSLFAQILGTCETVLRNCKNQHLVNISTDIVTSLSLHFSTAMQRYPGVTHLKQIVVLLSQMQSFYRKALRIEIGNVQFHTVQNATLFLHSIILRSKRLTLAGPGHVWRQCIAALIDKLFVLSRSSQFTSITDLCQWTICNFYYEFARFNAKQNADDPDASIMVLDDTALIQKYTEQLMHDRDYKIRRWCGMLIFLRFYFAPRTSLSRGCSETLWFQHIYQSLLLDFDECVSRPLTALCSTEDYEEAITLIESSNLLPRPNHLLSTNLDNEELIEGRSDTASINQARSKMSNGAEMTQFPGLLNVDDDDTDGELKIVDVDEMDDIEDISDDDDDDDDDAGEIVDEMGHVVCRGMNVDNKENNKLLSNIPPSSADAYAPCESSPSSASSSSMSAENDREDMISSPKANEATAEDIDDEESTSSQSDGDNSRTASNSCSTSSSASTSSGSTSDEEKAESASKKPRIPNIPLLPLNLIGGGMQIQSNLESGAFGFKAGNVRSRRSLERANEANDAMSHGQMDMMPEPSAPSKEDLDLGDEDSADGDDEREESIENNVQMQFEAQTKKQSDDDLSEEVQPRIESQDPESPRDEECLISSESSSESDDEQDQKFEDQETSIIENKRFVVESEMISNAEASPREHVIKSTFINEEIHGANDFISFKRGDSENMGGDGSGLQYIDSFLQSISTHVANEDQEADDKDEQNADIDCAGQSDDDGVNEEDVCLDFCRDENSAAHMNAEPAIVFRGGSGLTDETLEAFRRSDLNDYLVEIPRINSRKKGWWMKYLNTDDRSESA